MASSLLRLTTSVVPFRPAVAKAVSVVPFRHSTLILRSFSSPSKNPLPKFTFDLRFLSSQIKPGVPSILFTMVNDEEMTVNMPGLKKTENEEGVWLTFDVPKLGRRELTMGFEGFNFLIHLKTPEKMYLATIKLPENFNPIGNLKGRFEDGVCYICLPIQKTPDPILAMANINRELTRPTPYCDMFKRSDLGWTLCEIIAHPEVKSKSFTAYKKDTVDSKYMKGNLPGVEKMAVTREGLHVSLSMPGFELEDVEAGFEYDYDTLIVEGKREGEHYIAGVRVPEGFCKENDMIKREMQDGVFKENDMIKREMQDGVFKATLSRVGVNRLAFSVYR